MEAAGQGNSYKDTGCGGHISQCRQCLKIADMEYICLFVFPFYGECGGYLPEHPRKSTVGPFSLCGCHSQP